MNIAQAAADDVSRVKFSVEDVSRMIEAGILTEDDPVELVEGDLLVMAAKHIAHDRIKLALTAALARFISSDFYVGVEATIQLSDDTLLEPDLVVIPRALYRGDPKSFAKPAGADVPLLIEVVVSSLNYERRTKARLYARHGIREFWAIDANRLVTLVHTQPSGDTWNSIVEHTADQALEPSALPGISIKLSEID